MKLNATAEPGSAGTERLPSEREEHEREAERWARALALSPELVPLLSPSAWRGGVDGLTPSPAARGTGAPAAFPASTPTGRETSGSVVVVEVDGGDWGRISLSVSRTDGGLRVLIGARDAVGAEELLAERAALAGALARIGLRVESVQIVRGDAPAGAAQPPGAPAERARPRVEGARSPERPGRPAARKLKVIG